MIYDDLIFPKRENRPFFFTNFVATVDGKVQVKNGAANEHSSNPADYQQAVSKLTSSAYWPIGSETDFQTLLDLRAYSDILIHGKNTALGFNHLGRINSVEFKQRRKNLGQEKDLAYLIVTNDVADDLLPFLRNDFGAKTFIFTTTAAKVSEELSPYVEVLRFGKDQVDLKLLSSWLFEQGFKIALMEGGPTLLGEFLKEDLIDEVFLTIAPKIFGNELGKTLTLVEGGLFSPEKVKKLELLSVKQVENELYLRYSVNP